MCRLFLPISPGVAEELCRLFPCDDNVDMTPILRKSKEAARKQRLKPEGGEEKKSARTPKPLSTGRGDRFPGGGLPATTGDRYDRKRRYEGSYPAPSHRRPPPPKHGRYDDRDARSGYHSGAYPSYAMDGVRSSAGSSSGLIGRVSRSYDDYLRTVRYSAAGGYGHEHHHSAASVAAYSYHQYPGGGGGGSSRSYHDSRYSPPAVPYDRHYDRRNYDRSVEEFLRKTKTSSGETSRDRDRRSYRRQ